MKSNFSKLNTSNATLFTGLSKSFLINGSETKMLYPQQQWPWFWFWLVIVPYMTRAVFCSMDETLDVHLLPWFAISNSTMNGNSLRTLFNSKWMWSCVCPICNMTVCKLMEERAIMGLPSHYSICFSQLRCQMKKCWLKASVLYEQLLNSVYATLCPIHQNMFVFFVYWTICQLLSSNIDFFLQI